MEEEQGGVCVRCILEEELGERLREAREEGGGREAREAREEGGWHATVPVGSGIGGRAENLLRSGSSHSSHQSRTKPHDAANYHLCVKAPSRLY